MATNLTKAIADLRAEMNIALRQQLWSILGVLTFAIVVNEVLRRIG